MKTWLRRLGYLLIVIVWLMVMCFPTFAFTLAMSGQIQVGSNPGNHLRFFLVNEEIGDGIGVEISSPIPGKNCQKITVSYFFWEGSNQDQDVAFCQCFDPVTGDSLPTTENSCE